MKNYSLSGADTIAGGKQLKDASISIKSGKIVEPGGKSKNDINLGGGVCALPAFINAHDHLLANFSPYFSEKDYSSIDERDVSFKNSQSYKERCRIPNEDLYLLGTYKNLINGALTVFDHVPKELRSFLDSEMPVDIFENYNAVYSLGKDSLSWGKGAKVEAKEAQESGAIFCTHLAEGRGKSAAKEFETLKKINALNGKSLLVNPIALDETQIKEAAQAGSSFVFCPRAVQALYSEIPRLDLWLKHKLRFCVGTDSAQNGGGGLLEELRLLNETYARIYPNSKYKLSAKKIVDSVTTDATEALGIKGVGAIEKGYKADIMVVDKQGSVYNSALSARLKNVKIVIKNGMPVYIDEDFADILSKGKRSSYARFTVEGRVKLSLYDVKQLLLRIRKTLGYAKDFPFLPVE